MKTNRRRFLETSVAAGLGVGVAAGRTAGFGANDRVRVGFIGVGNRGSQLLDVFMGFPEVEVAALCDLYEPYLYRDRSRVSRQWLDELGGRIPQMKENLPDSVARYRDFRQVLDRKDIDAVVIATPDHWHALQMIAACESGKDVYVEKPLTATIAEGRKMVATAERTGRVVQVGLQRRSSQVYVNLPALIQGGRIGHVSVARAYHVSNMYPSGIGRKQPTDPPKDFDWDSWLGPREWRPFQENIHPYRFRWWGDYSSQVGNWGVHYFDAIRWMLGEETPRWISAHGGKYAVDDDRTIPDTMEVTYEFSSKRILVFGQYEASGGEALERGEIELRGTLGNLYSTPAYESGAGYRIVPSPGGQFQPPELKCRPDEVSVERGDPTVAHVRNFLDCVKSRQTPACPITEGHRSTTYAHLANIALVTGQRIEWDAENERIVDPVGANELLHYEYRKPWSL
jgi:predicted dehydrogenase